MSLFGRFFIDIDRFFRKNYHFFKIFIKNSPTANSSQSGSFYCIMAAEAISFSIFNFQLSTFNYICAAGVLLILHSAFSIPVWFCETCGISRESDEKVSFATLVATSFMRSITSFAVRQHRFQTANENYICALGAKRCSFLRSETRPKGSTPLQGSREALSKFAISHGASRVSLRLGRSTALKVHRTFIHYRLDRRALQRLLQIPIITHRTAGVFNLSR